MRKTLVTLALVLAVASTPADAYWIRDCKYSTLWSGQTAMVADINPGPPDAANILFGFSSRNHFLSVFDGAVYFQADDGQSGSELWRVIGGAASQVADILPGAEGSSPHSFAVFQNKLYFAATTPETGEELFSFDGTNVTVAAETEAGAAGGEINGLTEYEGALYFNRSSQSGRKVWRFNGTTVSLVTAINATSGGVVSSDLIADTFVVFKKRLYYVKRTALPEMFELWAFDGSTAAKIKSLSTGQDLTERSFELAVFKSSLFFGVVTPIDDLFHKDELWRYNGQDPPVKVFTFSGHAFSFSQPTAFGEYKSKLYFHADSGFFRTDGTTVDKLTTGPAGLPYGIDQTSFFAKADRLYFSGFYSDWTASEPYLYDGAITAIVKNIMPDSVEPYPGSFPTRGVEAGGEFYFYAADDTHGRELWRITGTATPRVVCDIVVAPIWVDKRLWVIGEREAIVATWVINPGAPPRLISREALRFPRGREARVRVLQIDTVRQALPEAFALASIVFDRETGRILDQGFDFVGTPTARMRTSMERAAARLLKGQSMKAVMSEKVESY